MPKHHLLLLFIVLACLPWCGWPVAAQSTRASAMISLRRARFDPLQQVPIRATARTQATSSLLLVQLQHAPDANTPAQLASAGLQPLVYVPDNAFIVRATQPAAQLSASWVRWSGPVESRYKLSSDLDPLVNSSMQMSDPPQQTIDLHVLTTPDAQPSTLADAVTAAGGTVVSMTGTAFHVRLPAAALKAMTERDDVLWIEPVAALHITNDKANEILGVPVVRQQLGLDGSGQIIAVTDTGLDVQGNLSADFAGRVVRGFSRKEMSPSCAIYSNGATWSDANGHGTHVAGTLLGTGALSPPGMSFAGVAPKAGIVVQAVSGGSDHLDCLPDDDSFLALAYDAGARIQNASFSGPTGQYGGDMFGRYTMLDQVMDTFLWQHKDHVLIASVGNGGTDSNNDGVVDSDSTEQPATAKNVLSVGASESNRPPTSSTCASNGPQNVCWKSLQFAHVPLADDFISNNPSGMAAFSSRGPADDGRIKPEIVAPGTNIISSRSHDPNAYYDTPYNQDYAYKSGTSMATPMVSGLAALTRQWLAQQYDVVTPSAALVKALLLNGATNITPGQYGAGGQREIPSTWPNNVEGWGRADIAATVGQGEPQRVWFADNDTGLQTGQTMSYTLHVSAGQPLRVTLAWTDYPASPVVFKTLVNDLDLEVQTPGGMVLGNASADLPANCRNAAGADRCNVMESIELTAPQAGTYTIRVHAAVVAQGGAQPFAVVAGAQQIVAVAPPPAPTLRSIGMAGSPTISLAWNASPSATRYDIEQQIIAPTGKGTAKAMYMTIDASFTTVEDVGSYTFRVRGCNEGGCGPYSEPLNVQVTTPPQKTWLPFTRHL